MNTRRDEISQSETGSSAAHDRKVQENAVFVIQTQYVHLFDQFVPDAVLQ